jgi:hypothetical protein
VLTGINSQVAPAITEENMTATANDNEGFLTQISEDIASDSKVAALCEIASLIQPEQYVGDLINLDYGTADILVHDKQRTNTNGIPYGCLLIASRVTPADQPITDPSDARASLLLLRVAGAARLNSDVDIDRTRFEIVQRSYDSDYNYDDAQQTDQFTLNLLRYSGVRCRILGTFRVYQPEGESEWRLHFGADIANFYAGQGMKIYKPNGESLRKIVNYRSDDSGRATAKRIGRLRYSAAIKEDDTPESVPIEISAEDFIAQRSAMFGMTRTGKSNTTKTIAAALFKLRDIAARQRVGQIIFDPNGEYANDNPQDQGCIRNLKFERPEYADEVHTYGSFTHPYDPDRHITKFNFFGENEPTNPPNDISELNNQLRTLYQGKQIIDDALSEETGGYVTAFCNVDLTAGSDSQERGEYTRFRRRLFIYRSILAETGFEYVGTVNVRGLFSKELRELMSVSDDMRQYVETLASGTMNWEVAGNFVQALADWVKQKPFKDFDTAYAASHGGRNWSDAHLMGLLRFYDNTRARAVTQTVRVWHNLSESGDYADQIVTQVRAGNLVIVDQLLGDPEMNKQAAERITRRLFQEQQRSFSQPRIDENGEIIRPPPVIVYAEEAHTLLPRASEDDNNNIWARIAKEGAKFNIGMVYSTQEPSSLQTNILKNTENWFIAHLNNTDETNQLGKYKDFADFTRSIIDVEEAGLLKIRTASGKFTLPVQMDLFTAPPAPPSSISPTKSQNQANGQNPKQSLL